MAMAKEAIVWTRKEAAQVRDKVESGGGKITRVTKLSDFPPRWLLVYVEKKNE
jgi:hypothetical protein